MTIFMILYLQKYVLTNGITFYLSTLEIWIYFVARAEILKMSALGKKNAQYVCMRSLAVALEAGRSFYGKRLIIYSSIVIVLGLMLP